MYRFFVEPSQVEETVIRICGSDVNHIKNVLRMKTGEEILISTGETMEYTCYIEEFLEDEVTAHIMYAQEAGYELSSKIYLFQGLPKSDKMEWIIQKAVELGVHQVIPVATKRAVVRLEGKKEVNKQRRWQAISESAAKQSKRMYVPEVSHVMSFKEALAYAKNLDVILLPYERAKGMQETKVIINSIKPGQSIGIFIGPEGGFDEKEVEQSMDEGAKAITLGKRILRTETAGLTVLSVLMFALEE